MMFMNLISSFGKRDRDYEVQVAARVGIENARRLLQILSHQQRTSCSSSSAQVQCGEGKDDESWRGESDAAIAGVAVSKFQKVVSLLQSRTGHARFRRAPRQIKPTIAGSKKKQQEEEEEQQQQQQLEGGDSMGKPNGDKTNRNCDNNSMSSGPVPLSTTTKSTFSKSFSQSFSQSFSKSFSVVSMDGSAAATDSNLQQQTSSLPPTRLLPQGSRDHTTGGCKKKSCSGKASDENKAGGKSCSSLHGRCHCSKRRKLRVKRTIQVPAISSKLADIPSDDYSWRKYGQKPIKGSPHPRGYYKCSSMRNCPARKHVERSLEDPSMLIVTYEGEHSHTRTPSTSTALNVQS
ncbi:unnamed protein product [Sphagnum compactum]